MSNSALKKLIRELVEEELAEISTSANAGPYNTPFAFRGNSAEGKAKARKNATQAGMLVVRGREEKADDAGEQSVETVPFGEKGAGALKKPKAEPKPKIEESTSVEDRIKNKEERLRKLEQSKSKMWQGSKKYDDTINTIRVLKQQIADLKKEKSSSKTEVVQENRYAELKAADGSPTRKIAEAVREINRQISEIDRVVTLNSRLKKESGLDGSSLYKNTVKSITRLESKLQHLSAKLRELKA
jgi:hypothetical protein